MYAGRIVERGPTAAVFAEPLHPYTQGLIRSVPRLDRKGPERLASIPGQPPSVVDLPECCPFHPRCDRAMDVCRQDYPGASCAGKGHSAHCWLYPEEAP
jgi:oligopeptide transport system ATP-binding protein